MDFVAFLIVNAILYLRPSELVPELDRIPLYYFAMLACLSFSIVPLLKLAFYSPLRWHPSFVLSLLMVFFAGISLIVNRDLGTALDEEIEFVKVFAYFVLFVAIVRTPQRLQGVIACVVLCMMVTAVVGMLHFFEAIDIPNLKQMEEIVAKRHDWSEGVVRRLRFTGIMDGPNEVAVFLSVLTFLCAYQVTNIKHGLARFLWAVPIAVYLLSIVLTRSRGGLLALLTGFVVFAVYGIRQRNAAAASPGTAPRGKVPIQGLLFVACVIPVLLFAAGGRQTEISTNAYTAQTRFGAWSDWLLEFRYHPLFGAGPKIIAQSTPAERGLASESKLLAHNSYLQPFADLGFFGGICFLGIVGFGFITLHSYAFNKTTILDPDLARLQPYLMAALSSCAVGFLTLSINYIVPVFFVFAIPVAYYGMTPCIPPIKRPVLTSGSIAWLVVAGIGFLAATYALILVMPRS